MDLVCPGELSGLFVALKSRYAVYGRWNCSAHTDTLGIIVPQTSHIDDAGAWNLPQIGRVSRFRHAMANEFRSLSYEPSFGRNGFRLSSASQATSVRKSRCTVIWTFALWRARVRFSIVLFARNISTIPDRRSLRTQLRIEGLTKGRHTITLQLANHETWSVDAIGMLA